MMKTISNSVFPAYDGKHPMILDEAAMAKSFRNAIAHRERFLGALLSDGHIVFVDVNRKALGDVFQLENGAMYLEGVGVIRRATGNDRESIIHELTGTVAVPERGFFREAAHSL